MGASGVIPGPRGNLVTGNLGAFSRDPLGFLTRSAREYGDVVRFRFLVWPAYLVNRPEYVETLLATRHREVRKGVGLNTPFMRRLLGNGLVTSEGEFWVRQRRLAQPAFHRSRIDAYAGVMVAETERAAARWCPGETLDLHAELMRLTLRIVVRTLFGVDPGGAAEAAGLALQEVMETFASTWGTFGFLDGTVPTPSSARAGRAIRQLNAILFRLIKARRASGRDEGDLLSMLLQARDEDGSGMDDRQLRDELMTFFFAGHETTAVALSWSCFLLATHPEMEAELAAEIAATLGDRPAAAADLPSLEPATRIVKEAMRLYPPVWGLSRRVTTAMDLDGHVLPAGASVILSQWVMHRDPRFYEQPERFDPDRWRDERAAVRPRFAYFPFGGGPRGCIGMQFALLEAVLILATLVRRYRLPLAPGARVTPWATLSLRPRGGVSVVITPRASAGSVTAGPARGASAW